MIDGIPNRPLYFYQKDIIDARDYERGYPLVNVYITMERSTILNG
jgi:hypothetical protein